MADEKSHVVSVRLPDELRDECAKIADSKELTTNEWIRRTLREAVDLEQDYMYQETLRDIDRYISNPHHNLQFNPTTRTQFIIFASSILLHSVSCPKCGSLNIGGRQLRKIKDRNLTSIVDFKYFCHECGTDISDTINEQEYAMAYCNDYIRKHPVQGDDYQYDFATPSADSLSRSYAILGIHLKSPQVPEIVKVIGEKEIEEGKKIVLELRDKEKRT